MSAPLNRLLEFYTHVNSYDHSYGDGTGRDGPALEPGESLRLTFGRERHVRSNEAF